MTIKILHVNINIITVTVEIIKFNLWLIILYKSHLLNSSYHFSSVKYLKSEISQVNI